MMAPKLLICRTPAYSLPWTRAVTQWQGRATCYTVAGQVGQLVNAGVKTATSSLLWQLEQIGDPPPQVGSYAIAADGAWSPGCIIEVTEVELKPFNEVDAQFAFDYGEYGQTLERWREASWNYFSVVARNLYGAAWTARHRLARPDRRPARLPRPPA